MSLAANPRSMLLYAITDRALLAEDASHPSRKERAKDGAPGEAERRAALVMLGAQWAARDIDYIQIREKDLGTEELRKLAEEVVAAVRRENQTTRVLLNGPAEIALAAGADGVHLPGGMRAEAASEARALYARSGREAIVSHACHSVQDVLKVREESQRDAHATAANTVILYAPVFEKQTAEGRLPGQRLDALRAAVHAAGNIPVFALGGVTEVNAAACITAGAAGIAGIRMFLKMTELG